MYLFTYGTLKSGQSRHGILARCKFYGEGSTIEKKYKLYHVLSGRFPALVEDESGRYIIGELYKVSSDIVRYLDNIEGIHAKPPLYTKSTIQIRNREFSEPVEAITYFWARPIDSSLIEVPKNYWRIQDFESLYEEKYEY